MTHPDPVEFVRQFDAQQAAAAAIVEADAKTAEARIADVADVEFLSPDGRIAVDYTGSDGIARSGVFVYRLAVTTADFLRLQVGMQRYTPPGLSDVPGAAEMLAVLSVTMRQVPDWIPRDAQGHPDWLNVDYNLATRLVEVVDQHTVRFRERVGAKCTPQVQGDQLDRAPARAVGSQVAAAVAR